MPPRDTLERVTALAGIYQAVNCVMQISRKGTVDLDMMTPCIHSLYQVDADTVDAVFGEPGALASGMRQLMMQLTGQPERNLELTRYVVQLIRLERNLSQRPDQLQRLADSIEEAKTKQEHFGPMHPNLLAHFAELYSSTISQLEPRIIIRGESLHLRNPDNQNRIRALLLAGVRAAMLWRQIGGSRWQILFKSRQLLTDAKRYLAMHVV